MAYLYGKDERAKQQEYQSSDGYEYSASFGETFAAGVGPVIDEGLTISGFLNNEGFDERKTIVDEMIKTGEIGEEVVRASTKYANFDYGALANTLNNDNIKTDEVLNLEKSEMLAKRRAYAGDVTRRGSGFASFLGEMNGYMLDPINMSTMLISAPVALGAAGFRAVMIAAARGGIISAGSEALIQPLVFRYKQEINSPYAINDAIGAIATAAIGGAALDGAVHGIGSMVRRLRGDIDSIKQSDMPVRRSDIDAQERSLSTMDTMLKGSDVEIAKVFYPDKADDFWSTNSGRALSRDVAESLKESPEAKLIRASVGFKEQSGFKFDFNKHAEELVAKKVDTKKAELEEVIAGKLPDKELDSIAKKIDAINEKLDSLDNVSNGMAKAELKELEITKQNHAYAIKAEAELKQVNLGNHNIDNASVKGDLTRKIVAAEEAHIKTYLDAYNKANVRPTIKVKTAKDAPTSNPDKPQKGDKSEVTDDLEAQLAQIDTLPKETKAMMREIQREKEGIEAVEACFYG